MSTNRPPLKGAAPPHVNSFQTGNGEVLSKIDCIFPIVAQMPDNQIRLLGTGFYICTLRTFVTATHVLMDVMDPVTGQQKHPIGIFHFYGDNNYMILPITWAWHSNCDVSIGVTAGANHNTTGEPLTNKMLTLTQRQPEKGELVATYAYPDSYSEQDGKIQKLYLRPQFYEGNIEEYYPEGRDRVLLPWPCYRTSIHLHGGSSGGPAVDKYGKVFGVNCRSMDPNTDVSFITPITTILGGYLENARFSEAEEPRRIYIHELMQLGHIVFD